MAIDKIRGSINVPLSTQGKVEAEHLGQRFAAKGGVTAIVSSDLKRAHDTAKAIEKHNPNSSIATAGPLLHPWHLGGHEGQPTEKVLPEMKRLILKNPDEVPKGKHPDSTGEPESFNQFKNRVVGYTHKLLQWHAANPASKLAMVTHYRDLRAVQGWVDKGAKPDFSINHTTMAEKGNDPPASVHHIRLTSGKPTMTKVNMEDNKPLEGGIYLVRHGATGWNSENETKGDT